VTETLANNAASTLNGGIDNIVTSLTVANGSVFPATGNFRIIVDTEIMICSARATNVLTVARGQETTSAASHSNGAAVTHVITKGGLDAYTIPQTMADAKGDLIAATGADVFAKVTVGANDLVLVADSTQSTGVKWGGAHYAITLPGSPVDSQEAVLVDSLTLATYQWRFRWNNSSVNTDKWEFIGGSPAKAQILTDQTAPSGAAWVNLGTTGPQIQALRSGVYAWAVMAQAEDTTGSGNMEARIGVAENDGTPTIWGLNNINSTSQWNSVAAQGELVVATPGNNIRTRYWARGTTSHFQHRQLLVWPVRVS
jgi:hypothetical protein